MAGIVDVILDGHHGEREARYASSSVAVVACSTRPLMFDVVDLTLAFLEKSA